MCSSLDCCSSLNLTLANEIKAEHGSYEGVYTFAGLKNGMDFFTNGNGHELTFIIDSQGVAMWYFSESAFFFSIPYVYGYATDTEMHMKCPNNEGRAWTWGFVVGSGFDMSYNHTDDVHLKCVDEGDFCTLDSPCGLNQGDCDVHEDCQSGFACGSNNCPDSLGYGTDVDCCFEATLGHLDYCTTKNKCGVNEGDCDKHDECQSGLVCGNGNCDSTLDAFSDESDCCYNAINGDPEFCTAENPCAADEGDCDTHTQCQTGLYCDYINDCPASLGFATGTNCCGTQPVTCPMSLAQLVGDGACDDYSNNEGCQWDGGDCCGDNVQTGTCQACACLDPAGGGSGCGGNTGWIGDSACDDINNNEECQWDGGDCCGNNVNTQWCQVCACLDPGATTMVGGSTMPTTVQEQSKYHA